jgi:hypothetical protein
LALGKLILIGGVALIAWWVIGRPTSIEELRADIDNITAQFKGQDSSATTATDPNSIDNTNTQDNTATDDGSGGQDQGQQQDDGSSDGGGDQGGQGFGGGQGGFGGGGRHRGGFGGGQGGGGDQGQQDDGSGDDSQDDGSGDTAPSIGGGGSQSGDTTSIPTQSSTPFSDGGSAHDFSGDQQDFGDQGQQQDDGSDTFPDQTPPPTHHHQHLTKAQRDAQVSAAQGKKPPHPQAVQAKKGKHEYSGKGNYKGTPGFYTVRGHHHCFEGDAGCKCTDCHKCNCHGPVGNGTHHVPPHAVLKTQAPKTQRQHIQQHNHPNLQNRNSNVKVTQTSHGGNNFSSTRTVNGKTTVVTNNPKHTKIVSNHPVHVVTQQHHHPTVVHHKKKKKKVVHHSNLAYVPGYDGGFHYLESSPLSLLYNTDY